jgi:hypothetical protein
MDLLPLVVLWHSAVIAGLHQSLTERCDDNLLQYYSHGRELFYYVFIWSFASQTSQAIPSEMGMPTMRKDHVKGTNEALYG